MTGWDHRTSARCSPRTEAEPCRCAGSASADLGQACDGAYDAVGSDVSTAPFTAVTLPPPRSPARPSRWPGRRRRRPSLKGARALVDLPGAWAAGPAW